MQDYGLDPTEVEYETLCKTYDSTNSRTNYLGKLENKDIWVAYRTWQVGPSERTFSIKGIGNLSVDGVSLSTEQIAEEIRERSTSDIRDDLDEWNETYQKLTALVENADKVAALLERNWKRSSEEIVYEAILDGTASVNQTTAWCSHVEEAYHYEVKNALRDAGIAVDSIVYENTWRSLSGAVSNLQNSWLKPHLEYAVNLEFEDASES